MVALDDEPDSTPLAAEPDELTKPDLPDEAAELAALELALALELEEAFAEPEAAELAALDASSGICGISGGSITWVKSLPRLNNLIIFFHVS